MKLSSLTYDSCIVEIGKKYSPSPLWDLDMHQEVLPNTYVEVTGIDVIAGTNEVILSANYWGKFQNSRHNFNTDIYPREIMEIEIK